MSKRLQVVMDERESKTLERLARREGVTVSEWVRRAIRRAAAAQSRPGPEQRLAALDRALKCGYPTGSIDEMLAEIERGRDLR